MKIGVLTPPDKGAKQGFREALLRACVAGREGFVTVLSQETVVHPPLFPPCQGGDGCGIVPAWLKKSTIELLCDRPAASAGVTGT